MAMMMESGLYIAKFRTPLDDSSGVIVINDHDVLGGDSSMFYTGSVSGEGGNLKATLRVRQHDERSISVFGEYKDFTLTLTGRQQGNAYVFEGRADRIPSLRFTAELKLAPV